MRSLRSSALAFILLFMGSLLPPAALAGSQGTLSSSTRLRREHSLTDTSIEHRLLRARSDTGQGGPPPQPSVQLTPQTSRGPQIDMTPQASRRPSQLPRMGTRSTSAGSQAYHSLPSSPHPLDPARAGTGPRRTGSRRDPFAPGVEEHVNLLDTLESQGSGGRRSSEHTPGGSQHSRSESPSQRPPTPPARGGRIWRRPHFPLGRGGPRPTREARARQRKALAERCKKSAPWITADGSVGAVCLAGAALAVSASQLRNERLASLAAMMSARAVTASAIHAGALGSAGSAIDPTGKPLPWGLTGAADATQRFSQELVAQCMLPQYVWSGKRPSERCAQLRKQLQAAAGPSAGPNEASTGQVGIPSSNGPSRKMKGSTAA